MHWRVFSLVVALSLSGCVGGPPGGEPPPSGDARTCRTALDCRTGEVCAVDDGALACRAPTVDDPVVPDGPDGQPAPPLGLLEGAARLSRTGDLP